MKTKDFSSEKADRLPCPDKAGFPAFFIKLPIRQPFIISAEKQRGRRAPPFWLTGYD
jgi:hypothetical protein